MIDFHSHLVPGVDDGAATLDESRAALAEMRGAGITALVTTPHLRGSLTAEPAELAAFLERIDEGWAALRDLATREFPGLRVERGLEVMLDDPTAELADPRVRLAGTNFVLVEFPFMAVPPNSTQALFALRMQGWTPVVAHPERYGNLDVGAGLIAEWRRAGAYLQVNHGSLVGSYGGTARDAAWRILAHGWADYLSSDYHARGTLHAAAARQAVLAAGGAEQVELLTRENGERLLRGEEPRPVPPLARRRPSLLRRIFRR